MLFITRPQERPGGYTVLSESNQWVGWLSRNIPAELDREVRRRLKSNLKHLLVGLELKAALINPHHHRGLNERPVLFEPYFQNLIMEFCVAAFSVFEGLGSGHWLRQNGHDGADARRINRGQWLPALCAVYDETGEHGLRDAVERTLTIRDKLHQDQLGAREDIDWHALSYDVAFLPASGAIRTLLRREADAVPETSNLHLEPN
ncbi:hypothetical protein [Novosphingobium mathurense]|uniref:Uncharacterized protein n=1 Tax=Novosphingobium mathurense TaxID=428990 RepID=A0A1U6IHJ0_9SPHN|nr:hypothetical protein [Novosphingobium mathurense]SLK07487.1 hypothetical protein SAMN06295987_106261 [Novosphingobium mathurense]